MHVALLIYVIHFTSTLSHPGQWMHLVDLLFVGWFVTHNDEVYSASYLENKFILTSSEEVEITV